MFSVRIGLATIFAAAGALYFASKSYDLLSHGPQYTGYPPKLTFRTSPSQEIHLHLLTLTLTFSVLVLGVRTLHPLQVLATHNSSVE